MHTVPLNILNGKENLPRHRHTCSSCGNSDDEENNIAGFNKAIDHLNQCTVGIDEEALAKLIFLYATFVDDKYIDIEWKEIDEHIRNNFLRVSKLIASKPELVIKIGRKK